MVQHPCLGNDGVVIAKTAESPDLESEPPSRRVVDDVAPFLLDAPEAAPRGNQDWCPASPRLDSLVRGEPPVSAGRELDVRLEGVEPPTVGSEVQCSIH